MNEAPGQAADRSRDRFGLEQGLTARPTDVADPASGGLFVAREIQDSFRRFLDPDSGDVPALDRMHRIAPPAAEIARVQTDENGRNADEGALPLDGDVAFAEEEVLSFAVGQSRRRLHVRFRCADRVLSVPRAPSGCGVRQRILDTRLAESLEAELAGVADTAGFRLTEVAGPGEFPGHVERLALPNDIRLGHFDEGRADLDDVAL